jgi:hypothetical protein
VNILKANSLRHTEPANVTYKITKSPTDHLFSFSTIYRVKGKVLQPIALLFQQNACHGLVRMFQPTGSHIPMASPDTLLHLYLTLHLFGDEQKKFFKTSLECLIQKIYSVSVWNRNHPTSVVPSFNTECSGNQKGVATLIKEKVSRIRRAKLAQYDSRKKTKKVKKTKTSAKSSSKRSKNHSKNRSKNHSTKKGKRR